MLTTQSLQLAHKDIVDTRDIGSLIRKARDKRAWLQKTLGADIGCSAAYITNLEKGAMVPTIEKAIKLEQSLNLAPGTLTTPTIKKRIELAVADILRTADELGIHAKVRLSFIDDPIPKRG